MNPSKRIDTAVRFNRSAEFSSLAERADSTSKADKRKSSETRSISAKKTKRHQCRKLFVPFRSVPSRQQSKRGREREKKAVGLVFLSQPIRLGAGEIEARLLGRFPSRKNKNGVLVPSEPFVESKKKRQGGRPRHGCHGYQIGLSVL